MKIFIITLPEAKGRQDHMRAQMKAQGLAFEFLMLSMAATSMCPRIRCIMQRYAGSFSGGI